MVGAGVWILGPIVIGEQSVIGSSAVVLKAVPSHSTVVGIPGSVVGKTDTLLEDGKINLDHHLMPNHVAEAIKHVLQMEDDVNTRVDHLLGGNQDCAEQIQQAKKTICEDMKKAHDT